MSKLARKFYLWLVIYYLQRCLEQQAKKIAREVIDQIGGYTKADPVKAYDLIFEKARCSGNEYAEKIKTEMREKNQSELEDYF